MLNVDVIDDILCRSKKIRHVCHGCVFKHKKTASMLRHIECDVKFVRRQRLDENRPCTLCGAHRRPQQTLPHLTPTDIGKPKNGLIGHLIMGTIFRPRGIQSQKGKNTKRERGRFEQAGNVHPKIKGGKSNQTVRKLYFGQTIEL